MINKKIVTFIFFICFLSATNFCLSQTTKKPYVITDGYHTNTVEEKIIQEYRDSTDGGQSDYNEVTGNDQEDSDEAMLFKMGRDEGTDDEKDKQLHVGTSEINFRGSGPYNDIYGFATSEKAANTINHSQKWKGTQEAIARYLANSAVGNAITSSLNLSANYSILGAVKEDNFVREISQNQMLSNAFMGCMRETAKKYPNTSQREVFDKCSGDKLDGVGGLFGGSTREIPASEFDGKGFALDQDPTVKRILESEPGSASLFNNGKVSFLSQLIWGRSLGSGAATEIVEQAKKFRESFVSMYGDIKFEFIEGGGTTGTTTTGQKFMKATFIRPNIVFTYVNGLDVSMRKIAIRAIDALLGAKGDLKDYKNAKERDKPGILIEQCEKANDYKAEAKLQIDAASSSSGEGYIGSFCSEQSGLTNERRSMLNIASADPISFKALHCEALWNLAASYLESFPGGATKANNKPTIYKCEELVKLGAALKEQYKNGTYDKQVALSGKKIDKPTVLGFVERFALARGLQHKHFDIPATFRQDIASKLATGNPADSQHLFAMSDILINRQYRYSAADYEKGIRSYKMMLDKLVEWYRNEMDTSGGRLGTVLRASGG